ncbi:MAG TPA: metal ABC transporter ATP-binding protein [Verrucomicrobiae bacterium]|nr:metal ABC transporter ATP-binding protein [Verrucomicrobiae bacterium]
MSEALITFENLSIGYNNQPVLTGISLAIARASFTSILGTNGSGKSTMLKTLLGLIPPVAGRIQFAMDADAPPIFGYVPQSINLDPLYPFTGFDVALMGAFGRVGPGRFLPSSERAFTHQCLAAAGADEFAHQRFAELSGGQKQRVLIARALVTRPNVLVLDEPTAGVDARATHAVLEFISRVHDEKQMTILLVTHDLPIVRDHAQEVIWLHQGRVLHGPVSELLSPERLAEIFEMEVG